MLKKNNCEWRGSADDDSGVQYWGYWWSWWYIKVALLTNIFRGGTCYTRVGALVYTVPTLQDYHMAVIRQELPC